MKITSAQPQWLALIFLIELLITPFLLTHLGQHVVLLYTVLPCLALLVLTALIRAPFHTPSDTQPCYSRWHYFKKIVSLELGYLLLFLATLQLNPTITPLTTITQSTLMQSTLAPWLFVALLACALVGISVHQKQNCYADTLASHITHPAPHTIWWSILNLAPRYVLTAFTGATLAGAVLMLTRLAMPILPQLTPGTRLLPMLIAFIVFCLPALLRKKPIVQTLYAKNRLNRHPVLRMVCFAVLTLTLGLLLTGLLAYGLPQTHYHITALQKFQTQSLPWLGTVFSGSWWFAAGWVITLQIAHHSRERSAKEIVCATLLLPMLFPLLLPALFSLALNTAIQHITQPILMTAGIGITFCGWKGWATQERLPLATLYHFPAEVPPKRRDPIFFIRQNLQIMLLLVAGYWIFPGLFMTFFFVAATLALVLLSPVYILSAWRLLYFRNKRHQIP